MRIEELSVGDWVVWYGVICRVDLAMLKTEFCDRNESKYVTPLKVKEQWLKKAGFAVLEKRTQIKTLMYMRGDAHIERKLCESFFTVHPAPISIDNFPIRVKYFHELQHAMRLLGIKEDIRL